MSFRQVLEYVLRHDLTITITRRSGAIHMLVEGMHGGKAFETASEIAAHQVTNAVDDFGALSLLYGMARAHAHQKLEPSNEVHVHAFHDGESWYIPLDPRLATAKGDKAMAVGPTLRPQYKVSVAGRVIDVIVHVHPRDAAATRQPLGTVTLVDGKEHPLKPRVTWDHSPDCPLLSTEPPTADCKCETRT